MERLELTAAPGDSGRLDAWLAGQCPTLSRSALQNLIEQGLVTCGGAPVNKKDKVEPGKVYAIDLPDPQPIEARPREHPAGHCVRGRRTCSLSTSLRAWSCTRPPGNPDGTLVNALLYHCAGQLSGIGGAIRPGIVHRIDKDTSGLLVVAKNDAAHQALSAQMSVHSIHRVYHAVVYGNLKEDEGFVEKWLGRDPRDRKKMAVLAENAAGAEVCLHGLAGAGTLRQFHLHCVQIKDRAHPSDSCTHGLDGASVGRGCCVRPQKLHQIAEWPVPARQGAGLCPPADRGVDAV